jgi:hypothetical protein
VLYLCNLITTSFLSIWQAQLKLPGGQILALFNKTIRRLHGQLHKAASKDIEAALPRLREVWSLGGHCGRSIAPSSLSRQLIELFPTEIGFIGSFISFLFYYLVGRFAVVDQPRCTQRLVS